MDLRGVGPQEWRERAEGLTIFLPACYTGIVRPMGTASSFFPGLPNLFGCASFSFFIAEQSGQRQLVHLYKIAKLNLRSFFYSFFYSFIYSHQILGNKKPRHLLSIPGQGISLNTESCRLTTYPIILNPLDAITSFIIIMLISSIQKQACLISLKYESGTTHLYLYSQATKFF